MIKVLAIMGSPRRLKNNDRLLDELLKGLSGPHTIIEKYHADHLNIQSCKACDGCTRKKGCVLKDDMINLYAKFDEADIVIMTSPLYFNSVSAQLKSVIDRCQALWSSKYVLKDSMIDQTKKRLGYFLCTAGVPQNDSLFSAATPVMDLFFKSINADYLGNLFFCNVDEHPVYEDSEALTQAFRTGENLLHIALSHRTAK
ncbi:NADPH-dependent FMN reductase [Alkaliphilus metalliredigens QYMF]|uniref:NADPH-dependent FMN reductase n=1 Tax=Alkaliphilus metalliredigens (strain QYMF) TaxID=293826 RepID=A6TW31_ALKMQ|nr:flavodoxin family protein [Alkaliphilus metalliredigens]ABR50399.1 NADPH-dependent FMN reductase [Alkaliphilus metalliredigens QYMF]